jgi:hypothetical protein
MLIQLNRATETLEQYRLSLKSDPNRVNALYALAALRNSPIKNSRQQLLQATARNRDQGTGSNWPELQHARKFVAETASSMTQ